MTKVLRNLALAGALLLAPTSSQALDFGVIEIFGDFISSDVEIIPAGPLGHFGLLTADFQEELDGNGPWELQIQVIDVLPGTQTIAVDKSVVNQTGFDFFNFNLQIIGEGVTWSEDALFGPKDRDDNFMTATIEPGPEPKQLIFSNGVLADGDSSDLWLGIEIEGGLAPMVREFTIRQSANVPEPMSVSLLGMGLLGLIGLRKLRSNRPD